MEGSSREQGVERVKYNNIMRFITSRLLTSQDFFLLYFVAACRNSHPHFLCSQRASAATTHSVRSLWKPKCKSPASCFACWYKHHKEPQCPWANSFYAKDQLPKKRAKQIKRNQQRHTKLFKIDTKWTRKLSLSICGLCLCHVWTKNLLWHNPWLETIFSSKLIHTRWMWDWVRKNSSVCSRWWRNMSLNQQCSSVATTLTAPG